jgi:hypothetical protein
VWFSLEDDLESRHLWLVHFCPPESADMIGSLVFVDLHVPRFESRSCRIADNPLNSILCYLRITSWSLRKCASCLGASHSPRHSSDTASDFDCGSSLSGEEAIQVETREMTEPESRPEDANQEEELDSLWAILIRRSDFAQGHLAGMEVLKRMDTRDASDDQMECMFRAECISWNYAICNVALNAARLR